MGKIVERNQPCLSCSSHDARQVYEDGGSKCFSCGKAFRADKTERNEFEQVEEEPKITKQFAGIAGKKSSTITVDEIDQLTSRGFMERGITKTITEFFGVKVSYNTEGQIDTHYYPSGKEGKRGYQRRRLPKTFDYIGDSGGLFGKDKFSAGGKRVIITEGVIDALSVAQAGFEKYSKIYPVVSMSSTTSTKQLLENREWLRSFKEIVLCFDNDEPGSEATKLAIKILGIDKVKVAKLPCKDPNDVLIKHGVVTLNQCIWDAVAHTPAGIIGKQALKAAMHSMDDVVATPYPPCLNGLNKKIKGMRMGEIALYISGTGAGKSTIIREIELHLLETTEDKIGTISLEEAPGETARNMAAMYLSKNPSENEISREELDKGFDAIFDDDRVIVLDHQGSIKDASIVDQLEYMCLMGCKYLFIDHITILVSEGAEGLTGNEAIDKIMNDLLRLVKKHMVHIGLVSHLRKAPTGGKSFEEGKLPSIDDIRGSGSIKQVSMDIIAFSRNMTAADESEQNKILMSVLKSRTTGRTGPIDGAYYHRKTGRLGGIETIPDEEFQVIAKDSPSMLNGPTSMNNTTASADKAASF